MEPWPGFQDEITKRVEARLFAPLDEAMARLQAVIDEGRALVASCEENDPPPRRRVVMLTWRHQRVLGMGHTWERRRSGSRRSTPMAA